MTKEELQNLINLIKGNNDMRLIALHIILGLDHNSYKEFRKVYVCNYFYNFWIYENIIFLHKTKTRFFAENKDTIDKIMKS